MRGVLERVCRTVPAVLIVGLAALIAGPAAAPAGAAPDAAWRPAFAGSSEATSYPPIKPGPATTLPDFIGSAVAARPLPSAQVPQDPALGPNPFAYVHNDSWNSDTAGVPGPLGNDLQVVSSTLGLPDVLYHTGSASTTTFDRQGRLITWFADTAGQRLLLQDPVTLDVLCSYPLGGGGGTGSLGSCYFYVDNDDRVVIAYGPREIVTLQEGGTAAAPSFELAQDGRYDLSSVIPVDDHIAGLLPDWKGRIWFQTAGAGEQDGARVGVVDPATAQVKWAQLPAGELVENGLAVDKTGSYVLTSAALYKFTAGPDGQPRRAWRAPYDHSVDKSQLGQLAHGSGTSPTILGGGRYVAINDSAEQMHVLVFRTATKLRPGQHRRVGSIAVFKGLAGQSCADSLLGYRDTIVVENNYGYMWSWGADGVPTSTANLPGLECVRITKDERLVKVWENDEVASNTVPKLSTKTGLVYVVARKQDPAGTAVYYLTALDHRTGSVVWQKRTGAGINWDGYWAAPMLGADGTIYFSVFGGMASLKDGR